MLPQSSKLSPIISSMPYALQSIVINCPLVTLSFGANVFSDTPLVYQNSYGISFGDNGKGEIPESKVDAVFALFAEEFELPFKDVDKDRWSYKNIRNLYLSGVINGKTFDAFDLVLQERKSLL